MYKYNIKIIYAYLWEVSDTEVKYSWLSGFI